LVGNNVGNTPEGVKHRQDGLEPVSTLHYRSQCFGDNQEFLLAVMHNLFLGTTCTNAVPGTAGCSYRRYFKST
jgi:hypothetical protein